MNRFVFGAIGMLLVGCALYAYAQTNEVAPGGGARPLKYDSAASTNSTSVTVRASTLWSAQLINTTVTLYYLKFYDENKPTGPACNTDTVIKKIPVPFGASNAGGGAIAVFPGGVRFNAGINFCLTGGVADNDNTNAATGVVINLDVQ